MQEKKVSFPDELLEGMDLETTIFTPENENIGVAVLSEQEGYAHVLRLYQLILSDQEDVYEPLQELAAFSFQNRNDLDEFLERLPHFSGLEMLMILNPLELNIN